MVSPRWRKVLRDVSLIKGRFAMMVLAIAVGIFGVVTILSTYPLLTSDISRNYLETNPASAWLELDRVDDALVDLVCQSPRIADAEASGTVTARIEIKPGKWRPLMLFVVENFNGMKMNTFKSESGAWPPMGRVTCCWKGLNLNWSKQKSETRSVSKRQAVPKRR